MFKPKGAFEKEALYPRIAAGYRGALQRERKLSSTLQVIVFDPITGKQRHIGDLPASYGNVFPYEYTVATFEIIKRSGNNITLVVTNVVANPYLAVGEIERLVDSTPHVFENDSSAGHKILNESKHFKRAAVGDTGFLERASGIIDVNLYFGQDHFSKIGQVCGSVLDTKYKMATFEIVSVGRHGKFLEVRDVIEDPYIMESKIAALLESKKRWRY
jgi:hypothetical protein